VKVSGILNRNSSKLAAFAVNIAVCELKSFRAEDLKSYSCREGLTNEIVLQGYCELVYR